jgi:hypothetical protein
MDFKQDLEITHAFGILLVKGLTRQPMFFGGNFPSRHAFAGPLLPS